MVDVVLLVGLILSAVALILDVALSFIPMWWIYRKEEVDGVTITTQGGLWRFCLKIESASSTTENCEDYTDDNYLIDKMFVGATQVFQCLGIILLAVTIIFLVLKLLVFKDDSFPKQIACVHAFWAGVCLIGSAGACGNGIKVLNTPNIDYRDNLHFSLAFAAISGVTSLIACVFLLKDMIKDACTVQPR